LSTSGRCRSWVSRGVSGCRIPDFHQLSSFLYVRMDEAPIFESEEVQPGFIVDFNSNGQVIGIEMHGVKARNPSVNPKSLQFEVA
jgi:uncharacterized protein YuzE